MPLGGNQRSISFWDLVVERIHRKLVGWKKPYISLGGRLTLIKADLSNVSVYYMSLFKMPSKIQLEVEKCQRNFLWSGGIGKKYHLVKWADVCRPKSYGGLGIGSLQAKNSSLLAKWLWRFSNEMGNLWHSIIHSKYGTDPDGWDCSNHVSHTTSLLETYYFVFSSLSSPC